MSYRVIYIPGIVDYRPWLQDKLIKLWRLNGLDAEYHAIGWRGNDFDLRHNEIIARIDELTKNGDKVAIVGVSAGASAALNAYLARRDKVEAVVFICGKVFGIDIQIRYFAENPAFEASLVRSDTDIGNLNDADKRKMLYIYTSRDRTVWPSVNHVFGVKQRKIFAFGHISGIYFTLLFHGRLIAKFIKNRSKIN